MKLWLLRWLWRSLSEAGYLLEIAAFRRVEDLAEDIKEIRSDMVTYAEALRQHHAILNAMPAAASRETADLAPALRQLVAYVVVSAYRGSDQEGVMAAIEEVWGPIKEHLVASGVLAKEGA